MKYYLLFICFMFPCLVGDHDPHCKTESAKEFCKCGCEDTYRGNHCSEKCAKHCKKCDRETGSCAGNCIDGYFGENCTQPCFHCNKCNKTGHCIDLKEETKTSGNVLVCNKTCDCDTQDENKTSENCVNIIVVVSVQSVIIVVLMAVIFMGYRMLCMTCKKNVKRCIPCLNRNGQENNDTDEGAALELQTHNEN